MGSLETELEAVVSSSEGRECGIVEGGEGDKEGIAHAKRFAMPGGKPMRRESPKKNQGIMRLS